MVKFVSLILNIFIFSILLITKDVSSKAPIIIQNEIMSYETYSPERKKLEAKTILPNRSSDPTIICRRGDCIKSYDDSSQTYNFNSVLGMFSKMADKVSYICEADPITRSCKHSGITFFAKVGSIDGILKIPSIAITQVHPNSTLQDIKLKVKYDMFLNGNYIPCTSTMGTLSASRRHMDIMHPLFQCQLTKLVPTLVSSYILIDYIDIDYGLLGGAYSIGLTQGSNGGATGYLLIKLDISGEPNSIVDYGNSKSINSRATKKAGEYNIRSLNEDEVY
ncbi:MAG: hypothetical protein JJV93_03095 [Alphaproteobacteria bacterium]|nr:hypothetical protein [Alphaproteobacteria bacterium]MBL0718214.1 hypothetical protein [Alphaproteobacteria bacterium]